MGGAVDGRLGAGEFGEQVVHATARAHRAHRHLHAGARVGAGRGRAAPQARAVARSRSMKAWDGRDVSG
jgi:anti-sigma factor RsiW